MKREIAIVIVLLCSMLFIGGCDTLWTGIGLGAGGSEALKVYEEGLEAKQIELDQLYDEEIARMEAAKDPNELAFHQKKVLQLQIARTANLGIQKGVQELRVMMGGGGEEERRSSADWQRILMEAGLALVLGNEYRKRRGFEKGIDRLTTEAEPAIAQHIHDRVKHSVRILG